MWFRFLDKCGFDLDVGRSLPLHGKVMNRTHSSFSFLKHIFVQDANVSFHFVADYLNYHLLHNVF